MGIQRISTGIPVLDGLIEGGFGVGKSYLVVGQPGTGKTVLGLQFLMNGLAQKQKGLYVAIDERPADVVEQAASLGWDIAPLIESKELLILDASAYFGARANDGQGRNVDVQRVVADLNSYVARVGASRVVIDPIGPLLFARDSNARVPDQARMLFYGLRANATTTNLLITYALDRGTPGIEEYLVSGTMVLGLVSSHSRFVRTLTIEKMRGTALTPARYLFDIVAQRGIVLRGLADAQA